MLQAEALWNLVGAIKISEPAENSLQNTVFLHFHAL